MIVVNVHAGCSTRKRDENRTEWKEGEKEDDKKPDQRLLYLVARDKHQPTNRIPVNA